MSAPKKRPPREDRTREHLARLNEARDFVALADALFILMEDYSGDFTLGEQVARCLGRAANDAYGALSTVIGDLDVTAGGAR